MRVIPRHNPKCGNNHQPLDKRVAVMILGEQIKTG
jgi:ATP-dependent helicase YprA (DUF1998 family)